MPAYDIQAIKARVRIRDLLTRDGIPIVRESAGGGTILCPFHSEKTPSCHIHENNESGSWYHCFGCGAKGDVIQWHQDRTGADTADAIADLAAIAGISPLAAGQKPLAARAIASPTNHRPATLDSPILAPEALDAWRDACDLLAANHQGSLDHLAEWRGYTPELCAAAARHGIIGILRPGDALDRALHPEREHFRQQSGYRYALIVTRPYTGEDAPIGYEPVGIHIRVAPRKTGDKQFWYYRPEGAGAWPLVFGHPHDARHLFFFEGQWDGLAFCSLLGWDPANIHSSTAIVCLRGSSSFNLFTRHYPYRKDATAYLFPDGDEAGQSWYVRRHRKNGDPILSYAEELAPRIRALHVFTPTVGKDFNDLVRTGHVTAPLLRAWLRPHMAKDRMAPLERQRNTYLQHVKTISTRTDADPELRDTAKLVLTTASLRPRGRPSWRDLRRLYERLTPDDESRTRLLKLAATYRPPPC